MDLAQCGSATILRFIHMHAAPETRVAPTPAAMSTAIHIFPPPVLWEYGHKH
jgi:hypothetical protein